MGPDELTLGTQGYIDEGLLLEETVKHGEEGGPVIVPLQTKLLIVRHLLAKCVKLSSKNICWFFQKKKVIIIKILSAQLIFFLTKKCLRLLFHFKVLGPGTNSGGE